jgi:hypothetical protein
VEFAYNLSPLYDIHKYNWCNIPCTTLNCSLSFVDIDDLNTNNIYFDIGTGTYTLNENF